MKIAKRDINSIAIGCAGGRESVNHDPGSNSKLLSVTFMAITCFLRIYPPFSLLPIFYAISSFMVQLRQAGVRKQMEFLLHRMK